VKFQIFDGISAITREFITIHTKLKLFNNNGSSLNHECEKSTDEENPITD